MGAVAREICIGSGHGDPGARVTIPVTLHDGGGVAGFQVDVHHDPDFFSFAGVRLGSGTLGAGNWSVLSAPQGGGVIRVLGVSGAGVGLGVGLKEMALVDFDVAASSEVRNVPFPLMRCVLSDQLGVAIPCEACVQPGVDAAFPRYAAVVTGDGFSFVPDPAPVESGDWVLWLNVGFTQTHTTTSGDPCLPQGLWDGSLFPGERFVRRFSENPGIFPYHCTPHCAAGHLGRVVVTEPILLAVTESGDAANLSWSGGSGQYRVFRSPNPLFVGTGQVELVPDGGASGTTLTDVPMPGIGEVAFYHVANG